MKTAIIITLKLLKVFITLVYIILKNPDSRTLHVHYGANKKGENPAKNKTLIAGGDLLSRAQGQISSALKDFTTLFGMGRGGTPSALPPNIRVLLFTNGH